MATVVFADGISPKFPQILQSIAQISKTETIFLFIVKSPLLKASNSNLIRQNVNVNMIELIFKENESILGF